MKIYYYTLTGNIPRFLAKCKLPAEPIGDFTAGQPFILVTNTLGFGQVPEPVADFLRRNHRQLAAIAGSGNRNWGANFAKAVDIISDTYSVPILHKFELSGTDADVNIFTERVRYIDESYRT